jgi:hypothetical protein
MLNYTVIILGMGLSRNMKLTEYAVRMGRYEKFIQTLWLKPLKERVHLGYLHRDRMITLECSLPRDAGCEGYETG